MEAAQEISKFNTGDLVCVLDDAAVVQQLQDAHGIWVDLMSMVIGQTGKVLSVDSAGDVKVAIGVDAWDFNPQCLKLIAPAIELEATSIDAEKRIREFQFGDTVHVLDDADKVRHLQRSHGGWSDAMSRSIGQTGKVINVESNGGVMVFFHNGMWIFNPLCLTPVQKESSTQSDMFAAAAAAAAAAVSEIPKRKFNTGDVVCVLDDADVVCHLQMGHGGWLDEMSKTIGQTGKVLLVDSDGDVEVAVGGFKFTYNPLCLKAVDKDSSTRESSVPDMKLDKMAAQLREMQEQYTKDREKTKEQQDLKVQQAQEVIAAQQKEIQKLNEQYKKDLEAKVQEMELQQALREQQEVIAAQQKEIQKLNEQYKKDLEAKVQEMKVQQALREQQDVIAAQQKEIQKLNEQYKKDLEAKEQDMKLVKMAAQLREMQEQHKKDMEKEQQEMELKQVLREQQEVIAAQQKEIQKLNEQDKKDLEAKEQGKQYDANLPSPSSSLPPTPPRQDIPDESWNPIWENVQKVLQEKANDMCIYAKLPVHDATQYDANQTEEEKVETMYDKYEAAIQNGTAIMSCGRIVTIGEAAERLMRDLMKVPTGRNVQNVYTICNENFCLMTEETEQKGLAMLVNNVIEKKSSNLLDNIASHEMKIVDVFDKKPDYTSDTNNKKTTIDDAINDGVKQIVIMMKKKTVTYHSSLNSEPSITPALIHTTNHSWKHVKHILPVLITSRSLFLVVISPEDRNLTTCMHDGDVITSEEDIYRCIVCIIGALSEKASELFKKLKQKRVKSANPYVCPYPQIVVVGTYTSDEQLTKIQSTIENIQKWVDMYCSDSAKHNFKAMVVNTVDQTIPDIQSKLTNFFTCDLQIPTPLSWELFRQIFSSLTKNFRTIKLAKAALIASLCGITTDDLPSVLNFYHEHGAFLWYPDVQYLNDIIILDPMWLQEKLVMILTPAAVPNTCSPIWKWHTTKGVLIAPHCKNPEEIEGLPDGLMMLLEKYCLAARIDIDEEISDLIGPKYFVPFVLKSNETTEPFQTKCKLCTAPLHFIFPKIKHLPSGMFTYLSVALASKENKHFKIDFKSEISSEKITYWFGQQHEQKRDKVILSATLTSICVVVERSQNCGEEYLTGNFGVTCQKIFSLLITEIEAILKKSFKDIKATPAFFCSCLPEGLPHYVAISTNTENTCDTLRCDENNAYTLNGCQQLWLKMAIPSYKEGRVYESELTELIDSLQIADLEKLTQALEVAAISNGMSCKIHVQLWSRTAGADARKHLMYHLNRLGMKKAAHAISNGIYCNKKENVAAVQKIFQKFYSALNPVNPDDIIAELFSKEIITEAEKDEINSQTTTLNKNETLLKALGRAINIDPKKFTTFVNILGRVDKYKPLVDSINAELY